MAADHTIEAHFTVKSGAAMGAPDPQHERMERVVEAMVDAVCPPGTSNLVRIRSAQMARGIYLMVTAMHEALAKEAR